MLQNEDECILDTILALRHAFYTFILKPPKSWFGLIFKISGQISHVTCFFDKRDRRCVFIKMPFVLHTNPLNQNPSTNNKPASRINIILLYNCITLSTLPPSQGEINISYLGNIQFLFLDCWLYLCFLCSALPYDTKSVYFSHTCLSQFISSTLPAFISKYLMLQIYWKFVFWILKNVMSSLKNEWSYNEETYCDLFSDNLTGKGRGCQTQSES